MRAALTSLQSQRPHWMLTELDLPDGSGLDLIRSVHQTPVLRHILLLVVTNRNTLRDKIAAFEAGADEYLVKPISAVYLNEHVERLSLFGQVIRN
jgi:DNA-binding response OmpR family regulator